MFKDTSKFENIPVENFDDRCLVKRILKEGTGKTIAEQIAECYGKKSTNERSHNNPIDIRMKAPELKIETGLKIQFHYSGYFEFCPAPFDSSQTRGEPWTEIIGVGKLLPALEQSILTMRLNEKAIILARHYLCFGESGCGQRIPKKADCMFKIWLSNINQPSLIDQFLQLERGARLSCIRSGVIKLKKLMHVLATESNDIKRECYDKQLWAPAQNRYERLIKVCEHIPLMDDEIEETVNNEFKRLYTNAALCTQIMKK